MDFPVARWQSVEPFIVNLSRKQSKAHVPECPMPTFTACRPPSSHLSMFFRRASKLRLSFFLRRTQDGFIRPNFLRFRGSTRKR
jgi:hypothetical protein